MLIEAYTQWPQLISAVGGVIAAVLLPYLVHRRIMADRDTRWHRSEERAVQIALIKKLQLEIEVLEHLQTPKNK